MIANTFSKLMLAFDAYMCTNTLVYTMITLITAARRFAGVQGGGSLEAPPYFFLIFILQVLPPWAGPKPLEGRWSAGSHTGPSGAVASDWMLLVSL